LYLSELLPYSSGVIHGVIGPARAQTEKTAARSGTPQIPDGGSRAMRFDDVSDSQDILNICADIWTRAGFVPLGPIFRAAGQLAGAEQPVPDVVRRLILAFNGSADALRACRDAARTGNAEAEILLGYMRREGLDEEPLKPLSPTRFAEMEALLAADPDGFLEHEAAAFYPHATGGRSGGFRRGWVVETLARSVPRFDGFVAARRSETAILVGNGPSLKQMDLATFAGQDVFISNYAIRHPNLRQLARGVAVSNELVAAQEPHVFQLNGLWKFHPFWLGHVLGGSDRTVWLNARGGDLFFSGDVRRVIAWHSTVTFFWLQILYSAGYRKVLLVGVDNSYVQNPTAREGDLLRQVGDDPNHFDPGYFRGKLWQAADTTRMEQTYVMAKAAYEADGREIVNCGIGGRLELFRRAPLEQELSRRV
jgi:hypothetical protein